MLYPLSYGGGVPLTCGDTAPSRAGRDPVSLRSTPVTF